MRRLWLAACAFAFLYVFPYQATLNNPNENVRLYMTAALAESGQYAIDAVRARWGKVNDAAAFGGHSYSVKAPGTSLLAVPGYYAYLQLSRLTDHAFDREQALWVCRVTASILPTLWFAYWFCGFMLRRVAAPIAVVTCVAVLLGSLLYGYGMLLVSHTLSAVAAFVAFGWSYEVALHERRPTPLTAAGAGLAAAAVTWFEYPGLVATLVLTVYGCFVLARRPRGLQLVAAWLAGCLPLALSMMHFQWRAFGNPFTPGHLFVESAEFRAAHEQGLYGAVGVSWRALHGLLLERGAGLFPLTPLLWLAWPGLWLLCRERRTRAAGVTCSALVILTTLLIASMNNWRGGWTIGPRYLAVCVPFLGFAAAHALQVLYARTPGVAVGLGLGMAAASCVASGLPGAYYPHLPPEFTRPLPQLFQVLISHGFAPLNMANAFGLWGTASLLPLALCIVGSWLLALVSAPKRALALGVAVPVALLCLAPLWIRPHDEPGVRKAVAFVTRRFSPSGHDRAAQLAAQTNKTGALREELRLLYLEEGRDEEATRATASR